MSKEKTPVQAIIERLNSGMESWKRIRDYQPNKRSNAYKEAEAHCNAIYSVICFCEHVRDNEERERIAVDYENGFRDRGKSPECIGGIRYCNEKYGTDE